MHFAEITLKVLMQELWTLHPAHRLTLIVISMKFHDDSLDGLTSYRADTIL